MSSTRIALRRNPCRVLGHELDNHMVVDDGPLCRRCHEPFLFEDGRVTHTRHVLACLWRGHTYLPDARRAGHREYACTRCGHPLVLAVDADPHPVGVLVHERVRIRCGATGHTVHQVTVRCGLTEYACDCGHSFLLACTGLAKVTHPLVCLASGHRVRFVERRGVVREHRCLDCGHPFLWMG
jgi:hypothetical protein